MSILTEAEQLINGARAKSYGSPWDNFAQTAALWEPILGVEISPEQVALCMIQVKVSRLTNSPDHRDSIVDIAGYAGTYEKVQERRAEYEEEARIKSQKPGDLSRLIQDTAQGSEVKAMRPDYVSVAGFTNDLPTTAPQVSFTEKRNPGPVVAVVPVVAQLVNPLEDEPE